MRILHLSNHCRNSGNGIVNVAVDLAVAQARQGHAVAFASAAGEFSGLLTRSGVDYREIDMRKRSLVSTAKAALALRRLLKEARPEIVHAHMMTGALLALLLKSVFGFKLVTHVHNEFQRSSIFMAVGDRVIANSQAVGTALLKRGISKARMRVALNGPLGTPRQGAAAEPAALQRPAIVTVAGLNHRKGIADLIDAFALLAPRYPDLHLYLVGDGPQREAFEQRASRSAVDGRIHFAGFAPDPRPYMLAADIFVLASHDEPFGLVLVEARALGCAIVATDVGGVPEALDNGDAGVLTAPKDPAALARAISGLLVAPAERLALKARATNNLDRYTVDRLNRDVLDIYGELIGHNLRGDGANI